METWLVIEILQDALSKRTLPDGFIFNSDRGSQYTCKEYKDYIEHHCIQHSYSAKGCPFDNSCIESFHATIKKECIYAETNVGYKDFQTCYDSIFKVYRKFL